MRHTKIIATIGPATPDQHVIEELIDAGVDICRLNFSHGSHEAHAEVFATIRSAAIRASKVVAILQDLSGPKIRTGRLKDGRPVDLQNGSVIRIETGDGEGDTHDLFTTCRCTPRSSRSR